ncbi:MAG: hypothetical protein JO224_12660 [Pelomonas sp.]|nr:hypothetical protein [Roseateles sp.]
MSDASKGPAKSGASPYDVAEHLRTPEAMTAYLEAWRAKAPDDAAAIARALDDIGRTIGLRRRAGVRTAASHPRRTD